MRKAKKQNMLHFVVSDSEAKDVEHKMQSLGMTNKSEYLRQMALRGHIIRLDIPQLHELIRLIGNMTNNINQIAKRINAHGQLYETEIDEIQENQRLLLKKMDQILKRLECIQ